MGNGDILFRGVTELRMIKDVEEGGVKKWGKSGDVLYGLLVLIFIKEQKNKQ